MMFPDKTGKPPLLHPESVPSVPRASMTLPISFSLIAIQLPPIKLKPFYLCFPGPNLRYESVYTSIALAFDSCAFITIVVSAYISLPLVVRKLGSTGVIRMLMQDATIYFGLIFTSHLIFVMFIFLERVCPHRLVLGCVAVSYAWGLFGGSQS